MRYQKQKFHRPSQLPAARCWKTWIGLNDGFTGPLSLNAHERKCYEEVLTCIVATTLSELSKKAAATHDLKAAYRRLHDTVPNPPKSMRCPVDRRFPQERPELKRRETERGSEAQLASRRRTRLSAAKLRPGERTSGSGKLAGGGRTSNSASDRRAGPSSRVLLGFVWSCSTDLNGPTVREASPSNVAITDSAILR